MRFRVLVADDSALFRRIIGDILKTVPEVDVVGVASNGKIALARIAALKPDLVTLDLEMPEMDGLEVLEKIRAQKVAVDTIVLSAFTVENGEKTLLALERGAFDFVTKPVGGTQQESIAAIRGSLLPIVRALIRKREIRTILKQEKAQPEGGEPKGLSGPRAGVVERMTRISGQVRPEMVLIGVSTGGPNALAQMLPQLPENLNVPVFIVQHMPPFFTKSLSDILTRKCRIPVREAEDGELARVNVIYLAPGGRHMKLEAGEKGGVIIRVTDDPPENSCKPSVDILFRSVASEFPGRALAVIMTGMGNDGTEGLKLLKNQGCFTIAQDEGSCVVFGMPKEAIRAGVIDSVVPLDRMAGEIGQAVRGIRS